MPDGRLMIARPRVALAVALALLGPRIDPQAHEPDFLARPFVPTGMTQAACPDDLASPARSPRPQAAQSRACGVWQA